MNLLQALEISLLNISRTPHLQAFSFLLSISKIEIEENDSPTYGYLLTTKNRLIHQLGPIIVINSSAFRGDVDHREVTFFLLHECFHFILNHPWVFFDYPKINEEVFNIATDFYINTKISELIDAKSLKDIIAIPKDVYIMKSSLLPQHVRRGDSFDIYAYLLGDPGLRKQSMVDDHGTWKQLSSDIDGFSSETKDIKESYESIIKTFSDEMTPGLDSLFSLPRKKKRQWKYALRSILSRIDSKRKKTWARESLILPDLPGRKRILSRSKILLIIDTSGSITTNDKQAFLNEMIYLSKENDIFFMCCDTSVTTPIQPFNPKKQINFKGGGGSDMNPAFDAAFKAGFENIILLTDGHIAPLKSLASKSGGIILLTENSFLADYPKSLQITMTP